MFSLFPVVIWRTSDSLCLLFLSDWIMGVFRLLEVKSSNAVRIRLELEFFCGWAEIFFNEML